MTHLAISVPGRLYREAITKALERTGNFQIEQMDDIKNNPDVALLGISVQQKFTLEERRGVIKELREKAPNCKIVLFLDELVSPEQTTGVKAMKQARLIDGFLYASGTMEYLVDMLESI